MTSRKDKDTRVQKAIDKCTEDRHNAEELEKLRKDVRVLESQEVRKAFNDKDLVSETNPIKKGRFYYGK